MTRSYVETQKLCDRIMEAIPIEVPDQFLLAIVFSRLAEMAYRYGHVLAADLAACVARYPNTTDMLANELHCEPRLVKTFVEQGLVDGDDVVNALQSWDWKVGSQ